MADLKEFSLGIRWRDGVPTRLPAHSVRIVRAGLTGAARAAGTQHAASATAARMSPTGCPPVHKARSDRTH
jgi:hypothetical protein